MFEIQIETLNLNKRRLQGIERMKETHRVMMTMTWLKKKSWNNPWIINNPCWRHSHRPQEHNARTDSPLIHHILGFNQVRTIIKSYLFPRSRFLFSTRLLFDRRISSFSFSSNLEYPCLDPFEWRSKVKRRKWKLTIVCLSSAYINKIALSFSILMPLVWLISVLPLKFRFFLFFRRCFIHLLHWPPEQNRTTEE